MLLKLLLDPSSFTWKNWSILLSPFKTCPNNWKNCSQHKVLPYSIVTLHYFSRKSRLQAFWHWKMRKANLLWSRFRKLNWILRKHASTKILGTNSTNRWINEQKTHGFSNWMKSAWLIAIQLSSWIQSCHSI